MFCGPLAALLLGSAPAFAQAAAPLRVVEYAAKFMCGAVDAKEAAGAAVRPGTYETSINIHNPQILLPPPPPDAPPQVPRVFFAKKAVLAPAEGEKPIAPSGFRADFLLPDYAMQVDCKIIRDLLGPAGTARFIEGFVVLLVIPLPAPAELDVVGIYTVDTPQQSISLEMLPIAPRTVSVTTATGARLRDMMKQATPGGG